MVSLSPGCFTDDPTTLDRFGTSHEIHFYLFFKSHSHTFQLTAFDLLSSRFTRPHQRDLTNATSPGASPDELLSADRGPVATGRVAASCETRGRERASGATCGRRDRRERGQRAVRHPKRVGRERCFTLGGITKRLFGCVSRAYDACERAMFPVLRWPSRCRCLDCALGVEERLGTWKDRFLGARRMFGHFPGLGWPGDVNEGRSCGSFS